MDLKEIGIFSEIAFLSMTCWVCEQPEIAGIVRNLASDRSLGFRKTNLNKVRGVLCSVIFHTLKIRRKYLTLPHLNAVCHQMKQLACGKKFTRACEGLRSPHARGLHWNPPSFRKKWSDTFLTGWYITNSISTSWYYILYCTSTIINIFWFCYAIAIELI